LFVKQIHAQRRTQLIQPEIQKIQKKHKGRTDPESRQAMTQETIGIQDWPDARTDAWRNAVRNHRHYQVRILLHSQQADMPTHPLECRPPQPTADQPERRMRIMSQAFYSHARLYDLMFPGGGPAVDFFRAEANRQGGSVLELGCGTGHKLIPIASDGHPCVGLDSSSDMLAEAQRKANERGVPVEWMHGDMRAFDLGGTFDFVFITANSLLHLHEAEDLVSCFLSVRRHMAPGARFVFDVFNPSVRLLAEADGLRRTRESLSFTDPDRGDVSVDVAEIYDAPAQVTRGTWYLSANSEPDFVVAPLEIRSIFPQELPLLVSLGGLRLVERFGDWSGRPFAVDTPLQLCICESA
jgi:SAM-dependent methyltransferase